MLGESNGHKETVGFSKNSLQESVVRIGSLKPLRTKAEVEASYEVAEAFAVQAPAKSTAVVLRLARKSLLQNIQLILPRAIEHITEDTDRVGIAHLRRVIKQEQLPSCLHETLFSAVNPHIEEKDSVVSAHNDNGKSSSSIAEDSATSAPSLYLCILLCVKSVAAYEKVYDSLAATNVFRHNDLRRKLSTILIPVTAPSSEEQARQWSQKYWPTIYKKHNPFGPQHNIIEEAYRGICGGVGFHMDLAARVGQASLDAGLGENIGAIIVDRSESKQPKVIVAAGDARWQRQSLTERTGAGNVMAHPVMRAIGMIARKRRECSNSSQNCSDLAFEDHFAEVPLTDTEKSIYSQSSIDPNGYLCLNLEMYVTHEPCIMCSMAMLHSRLGRVVFGIRMISTGGLVAEEVSLGEVQGLGYGLFWRPALNWKFLAWQWIQDDNSERIIKGDEIHA